VQERLLMEWPEEEEQPTKYLMVQLGAQVPGWRQAVRTPKARWRVEQASGERQPVLAPRVPLPKKRR